MKSIIKYVGIALVIVGLLLVMKNLFSKDIDLSGYEKDKNNNNNNKSYAVKIKLLDKESKEYLSGSKLILKDEEGNVVAEWTTEDKVYIVNKLEKGKYTLIQESASENYHLNKNGITFEITGKDREVVMYNVKMTDEEIKESNTVADDVVVDNTASSRSILTVVIAMLSTMLGFGFIYKCRKNY